MNICDIYLMLHRVSIFDFATLEAMHNGKAIILSNIPGNDEYNKENNICLIDEPINWDKVENLVRQRVKIGKKNKLIYEKYFSERVFVENYHKMLRNFVADVEGKVYE